MIAGVIVGWIAAWLWAAATPTRFTVDVEFTEELVKTLVDALGGPKDK